MSKTPRRTIEKALAALAACPDVLQRQDIIKQRGVGSVAWDYLLEAGYVVSTGECDRWRNEIYRKASPRTVK